MIGGHVIEYDTIWYTILAIFLFEIYLHVPRSVPLLGDLQIMPVNLRLIYNAIGIVFGLFLSYVAGFSGIQGSILGATWITTMIYMVADFISDAPLISDVPLL